MRNTTQPIPAQRTTIAALAGAALVLSACGGGTSETSSTPGPYPGAPILQVGMHRDYTGTTTRTVVHANPSSTAPDYTLAYSFTEAQDVLPAPASAPGTFDVRSVYQYTLTQDPGTGSAPISQTVHSYKNLIATSAGQAIVDLAQTTSQANRDEASNALGDGPYTQTSTTQTTYTTPRTGLFYPLQAGASLTVPQSSTQNTSYLDVNAAGLPPSNGNNPGYTRTRTQRDDGSFSFRQNSVNGSSETLTQNADGSGSTFVTNSSGSTVTTVGVPLLSNGTYTIPVSRVVTSSTPSSKNYVAADWYPNGGTISAPLVVQKQTVVGPVSSLPEQCNGALLQPNMYEIDSTSTSLNTIGASTALTSTRTFSANGVAVCTLTQQTSTSFNLLTGALAATTTTQTVTLLKAMQ